MRKEFSAKTMVSAALRANGHCEECGRKLLTGDFYYVEYDHVVPCGLGGSGTLDNCRCVCRACHGTKTKADMGRIAKAKRNFKTSHGIRKKSKFPYSRDSKFRKKISGEVVRR